MFKKEELLFGDPSLASLNKGDIIQLQRKGFFICDQPYEPLSRYSGLESPCILFYIPDGHQKEKPKSGSKFKQENVRQEISAKEKAQSKKGKSAEKSPQEEFPPTLSKEMLTIDEKIRGQGTIVRKLKEDNAAKDEISAAVKILLDLKNQLKTGCGYDWKPDYIKNKISGGKEDIIKKILSPICTQKQIELDRNIQAQGNTVRKMKSYKAPKEEIDAQVKMLLSLKVEYKHLSGIEWKPAVLSSNSDNGINSAISVSVSDPAVEDLNNKITIQGNKVRQLKIDKSSKEEIDAEVKSLISLKADYKSLCGKDWNHDKTTHKKQKDNNKDTQSSTGKELKKMTRLGLEAKKEENLSDWYSQSIEAIDHFIRSFP